MRKAKRDIEKKIVRETERGRERITERERAIERE